MGGYSPAVSEHPFRTPSTTLVVAAFLFGCTAVGSRGLGGAPLPSDAASDAAGPDLPPASDAPLDTGQVALVDAVVDAVTDALDVPVDASSDAPVDLPVDVSVDTGPDVSVDTPPATGACALHRDCAGRGVCDHLRGQCVACVTGADCVAPTPVCRMNRCVAPTPCASSRACPGQVCDPTAGYCIDCLTDVDCVDGTVCRRGNCVPPPIVCRSSRECGAREQVCDTVRGQCVDCAADVDCVQGLYCAADRICVRQACTPNATECLDTRRSRS